MRSLVTSACLIIAGLLHGQIRLTTVDPATGHITLSNFGDTPVDVSGYRLCALFEYTALNQPVVTVAEGSLVLNPSEDVTIHWDASNGFNTTASDLGLYLPTGGFADPAAMVSFFQYGAGQQGRENVAVAAGLWEFNAFLTGSGPWYYTGNGAQSGSAYWSETPPGGISVVINEVDADTPGTDVMEFIELYGTPNAPLDGYVVVLFNGSLSNNGSYAAYDLDGFSLNGEGFFVIGNTAVPNVGLVIPSNAIQNGADGIGLYLGNAADWPNNTAPSSANLIDAIVYGTNDPDDTDLLAALTPGQIQVNETPATTEVNTSMSRVPDGGEPFNSAVYAEQAPTPGALNSPPVACSAGSVSLNSGQLPDLCIEEPNAPLQFESADAIGDNYSWFATDAGQSIVRISGTGTIDFNGLETGTYTVFGIAWNGELTGFAEGNTADDLLAPECLSVSSVGVTVTLSACSAPDCDGGLVSANNGSVYFSFCKDGNSDELSLYSTTTSTESYTWVITTAADAIVATVTSPFDFDALPAGEYRIRGISHSGVLDETSLQPGNPVGGITTDGACVEISPNFIHVISQNCTLSAGCAQLFISEYIEGLSNNKALEVYNPTAEPVNLSGYGLYTFNNGSAEFSSAFALSGTLNPGATYVVANSQSAAAILSVANATSNIANFNGDDAIQLRFNDQVIDQIGEVGIDPGVAWTFAGNGSTMDRVLVRKPEVNAGTANWTLSTGQWLVYPPSDFSHIGNHAMNPCPGNETAGFTISGMMVNENVGTVSVEVVAFGISAPTLIQVDHLDGTATPDEDFVDQFPVSILLPVGNSTHTVEVTIIDDNTEEGVEYIRLALSSDDPITFTIPVTTISIAPNDPVYEYYTIAEISNINEAGVMDSTDVFCELRGIVHGVNFNSQGLHFHLIDATDGIKVFSAFNDFGYAVSAGDSIHVRGMITQFFGQAEVYPDAIDFISSGHPLMTPLIVTELNESHESMPVSIQCVRIDNPEQWTGEGNGFFVEMSNGGEPFVVRVDGDSELFGELVPGGRFTLTGLVEQEDGEEPYDSDYRIWPGMASDISDQVIASFEEFNTLQYGDNGAEVDFQNTSTGADSYVWQFGDGEESDLENPVHTYDFDFLVDFPDFQITLIASGACTDTTSAAVSTFYVGVDELNRPVFTAYPNPSDNFVQVQCEHPAAEIRLCDMSGRAVISRRSLMQTLIVLDLSALSAGAYLLEVTDVAGGRATSRIMKN
jgi:hypothetical protein